MNTNNIDQKFKDIIEGNPEFYHSDARKIKDRVWDVSSANVKSTPKLQKYVRGLVAACIACLLLSTFAFYNLYRVKQDNENLQTAKQVLKPQETKLVLVDTIVVEKKIYDTIVQIIEVEVPRLEYITETVYKTDTVFVVDTFYTPQKAIDLEEGQLFALENKTYPIERELKPKKKKSKNFRLGFGKRSNGFVQERLTFRF